MKKDFKVDHATCYLCDSFDLSVRTDKIRYGVNRLVYECNNCHLVFLHPTHDRDEIVSFYRSDFRNMPRNTLGLPDHDPLIIFQSRKDQAERRLTRVKPYLSNESRLLEIGCAAGSFIAAVKPLVRECHAVELDSINAKFVRDRFHISVWEKPIENLPNQLFDVICMWHVLEHVSDPVDVILKLLNMLTPNGVLFLEVPNILDPLLTIYKLSAFSAFYYQSPHLYYFSPSTLSDVFYKARCDAEIHSIQIYGLKNHIRWVMKRRPQKYQESRPKARNVGEILYRSTLELLGKTDTIFAIVKRRPTT